MTTIDRYKLWLYYSLCLNHIEYERREKEIPAAVAEILTRLFATHTYQTLSDETGIAVNRLQALATGRDCDKVTVEEYVRLYQAKRPTVAKTVGIQGGA